MDFSSRLYPIARRFYEAPTTCFNWRANNGVSRWVRQEAKSALNYDFHKFVRLDLGKVRTHLADIPKGAILLLLYPATVGPRLYRAWQRGRENNDYREVGDILRRDLTAITLLLYALPLIVRGLAGQMQKIRRVNLLDPKNDKVLVYSQLKDFHIENPKVLQAVLKEKNGKALKNAVNGLNDNGLSRLGHTTVADRLHALKTSVQSLVDLHDAGRGTPEAITRHCEETFQHFNHADEAVRKALMTATEKGHSEMQDAARGLQGQVKGVLQHYAKVSRLPVDLVSLGVVVGLTGWFPVWFNSKWNQWQFQRKKVAEKSAPTAPAAHAASAAALPSAPSLPAVRSSSPVRGASPNAVRPPAFQAGTPLYNAFAYPAPPAPTFTRWG